MSKIDESVEAICEKGCQAVRVDMLALRKGLPLLETQGLSHDEVQAVYKELESIMSVYGDACRLDGHVERHSPKRRRLVNQYLLPTCSTN
jgi:hypothetical protein